MQMRAPGTWQSPSTHFEEALGSGWYRTIFDLFDVVSRGTTTFMHSRGLKAGLFPITTSSISSPLGLGSDSLPVEIDLFGVNTFLADSMQFMLEYGCRFSDAGCYYVMPSFRGEATDARHLAQFYHSEAEIPGGFPQVVALVEDYLGSLVQQILTELGGVLGQTQSLDHLTTFANRVGPLPQITLDGAVRLLREVEGAVRADELGFRTITSAGERELIRHHGGPVWLTELDHLSVPFYQAYADDTMRSARCGDLLMGIGETVGAGERHAGVEDLLKALNQHGVDRAPYEWYARMRELTPLQTSGFGLGIERFLCWVLDHDDVRDIQIVPRSNGVVIIP